MNSTEILMQMRGEICTRVVSALLLNRDKSENPKTPFTGTVSRPDGSSIGWDILWLNPRNLGMEGYPEYTSIYIKKNKKTKRKNSMSCSWIASLSAYQGFFYFPGKPFEKNYTKKLTTVITEGRMIRNISFLFSKFLILFLAVILKTEHRKGDDRELKRLGLQLPSGFGQVPLSIYILKCRMWCDNTVLWIFWEGWMKCAEHFALWEESRMF